MADDRATILDMVLACRRIGRFIAGVDEAAFVGSEEKRWAVVSQLSIVGESVRRLSPTFREAHPQFAWRQIAGMRDRLIHGYDKIDWSVVWVTATQDVPKLMVELEPLLPPTDAGDSTTHGN